MINKIPYPFYLKERCSKCYLEKTVREKGITLNKRLFLVLLSFLVIFSSGIFLGSTEAEVISAGPKLKQVGPINESNGFPVWYKDSNGVKLQLCLDTE